MSLVKAKQGYDQSNLIGSVKLVMTNCDSINISCNYL